MLTPTIQNPSFCAIQFRNNILLKSFPILSILMFFIYFHPYFNSYVNFRQEYFGFRSYFCLIADIQEIISLPLPFHHSLIRKIKFITKQSTTSFPLYLI